MRIALGPAGAAVIESVAVPSGADSVSAPFSGAFNTWFVDGTAFLTNLSTTVRVYAPDASQLEIVALPSVTLLAGEGQYLWTNQSGNVTFYTLSGGSTPVAQYNFGPLPKVIPTRFGIIGALQYGLAAVDIIQLGATVTHTQVPVPGAYNTEFAADTAGHWSVGNGVGVLSYQGTVEDPTAAGLLGCGQVFAVAGSANGIAAIGTATSILVVDTSSRTVTQQVNISPALTLRCPPTEPCWPPPTARMATSTYRRAT